MQPLPTTSILVGEGVSRLRLRTFGSLKRSERPAAPLPPAAPSASAPSALKSRNTSTCQGTARGGQKEADHATCTIPPWNMSFQGTLLSPDQGG